MLLKQFETKRLVLHEITNEEWQNYFEHITASDDIFFQYGQQPSRELIEYIKNPTPEVVYYSVILKATGGMVGYVGIPEFNSNIEYYIFKEFRRNGYALEALGAFCEAYLDGKITEEHEQFIEAEVIDGNEASKNLLKKAGFKLAAVGMRFGYEDENEDKLGFISGIVRYEYSKDATEQCA